MCNTFDDWINVQSLTNVLKIAGRFSPLDFFLQKRKKNDAWLIDMSFRKSPCIEHTEHNGLFVSCLQVKIQSICCLISPDLNAKCVFLICGADERREETHDARKRYIVWIFEHFLILIYHDGRSRISVVVLPLEKYDNFFFHLSFEQRSQKSLLGIVWNMLSYRKMDDKCQHNNNKS